jgi:glucokinase
MAKEYWIGFDLGGTKMMATVFDKNFKMLGTERKKTRSSDGDTGPDRLIGVVEKALDEAHVDKDDLCGIGIGFPGPLDLDKGIVLESPNLGWRNFDLKGLLEKKFKCDVVVGNDVDVGTYGEYKFGAGQKARCVVGVFPGTGIGGGCIYEGKILRGKKLSCLEIGHMQMIPNGRLCGCGRRGCLETISSRLAIASDAAVAVFRGEAPHLAAIAGTDLSQIRSGALAEAIHEGDEIIEQIVRNAARSIGVAVANTVNLLAPDIVILGGGLVEAMKEIFVEEVSKAVDKYAMKSLADEVEVAAAKLGDDAGVMGAAALAKDTFSKE